MNKSFEPLRLCPEHNLPLVRHDVEFEGVYVGGCWDCPGKMSNEQQKKFKELYPNEVFNDETPCFYHVHETEEV
jgi:hypothetical protein